MDLISILSTVLKVAVALTVFGYGLSARTEDLLFVLRRPRLLFVSIVAMFVVMPVVALAAHAYLDFPHAAEVALVVIALTPIPALLPRTEIGSGGRARYAFGLAFAVALLSPVIVPALSDLIGRLMDRPFGLSPWTVAVAMLTQILLPLGLGWIVGRLAPRAAERLGGPIVNIANLATLLALVVLLVVVFPAVLSALSLVTLLVMFGFTVAGLAVGHALAGPDRTDSVVLAIACANRNPGLAIGLAAGIFPAESFAGTVIIYALVSNVAVTLYTRLQRRRGVAPAPQVSPTPTASTQEDA
ncbi:bile acid:sodium symporter family protein [Agromyces aurantiacus]|uniref:Bile acid:sodium symporter family protein n=1 Tax=Agromyces aurantiacus TaxID=165814 RepID=A0ABV9RBS4_9MICO|nr:bile acid:sodium symporter [Agromyces aurantiacus]MBM7505404.1 BASS family bile acid:Na+ symporter [Agromyces aurantiacus]